MTDEIIIIGAGAAGMMAAIQAARGGKNVTLLERNDRPGRKIVITGKGRCNVTNVAKVHEMEEVIYSLPNMAEYLSIAQDSKIYSALVERFSAPYYSEEATMRVHDLFPELSDVDSVFQKRYFSQRSQNNEPLRRTPNGANIGTGEILKFDPGWNGYYSATSSTTTAPACSKTLYAISNHSSLL